MQQQGSIPVIYTGQTRPARLSAGSRLLTLGVGLGCLILLGVSASLAPDPSGVGTHHSALRMAACQFLTNSGIPCPSCGMTTSFAHFADGNLLASLYVQPMGFALACLTGVAFWVSLYAAVTGRPVYRLLQFVPAKYWLIPLLVWAVLGWGWKILIHLAGVDGWG